MATDEIKKGDAVIRCCVEGKVKEYKIRITKTDKHTKEENKGLEIKVTDPELLEITGGIIQGMSGAPTFRTGKSLVQSPMYSSMILQGDMGFLSKIC